jgi:hypothetical protein
MKKALIAIAAVATLVTGVAQAATNGNYTQAEKAQLNKVFKEFPMVIAKAKIAIAEGNKEEGKKLIDEGKTLLATACAIYKKDPIDYTDAGCHKK